MPVLSNRELLRVWEVGAEVGAGQGTTRLALLWLAAGWPEQSWNELAVISLGVRDRRLLELYRDTFGDALECQADCPECGEDLEADLSTSKLLAGMQPAAAERQQPAAPARGISVRDLLASQTRDADASHERHTLEHDGLRLVFRLPNSTDLLAAEACGDASEARRILSERCVLEAHRHGEPVPLGQLRDDDVEQLAESMTRIDPAVEVRIAFQCPACGHSWKQQLDIVNFLDQRGRERSRRLLQEVHLLARSYGWGEDEILTMSDHRRRTYLEMLGHV